jgi:hypothetical protein
MKLTKIRYLLYLCLAVLAWGSISCSKSNSISCPSYWEGDKTKDIKGTNTAKDADGNVVPKDAMPTKSPVKKNKKNGLIDKKQSKKMNANYYRKR